MNKIFYTISIKKCLRENFIKKKLRTCTPEGKNGKRKQCTIYDERVQKSDNEQVQNEKEIQRTLQRANIDTFFILGLFVIAFFNFFVINGTMFPLTIFSFSSAYLFKIALKVSKKFSYTLFFFLNFFFKHFLIEIVQNILFIKLFITSENNVFWWKFFRHEIITLRKSLRPVTAVLVF